MPIPFTSCLLYVLAGFLLFPVAWYGHTSYNNDPIYSNTQPHYEHTPTVTVHWPSEGE